MGYNDINKYYDLIIKYFDKIDNITYDEICELSELVKNAFINEKQVLIDNKYPEICNEYYKSYINILIFLLLYKRNAFNGNKVSVSNLKILKYMYLTHQNEYKKKYMPYIRINNFIKKYKEEL